MSAGLTTYGRRERPRIVRDAVVALVAIALASACGEDTATAPEPSESLAVTVEPGARPDQPAEPSGAEVTPCLGRSQDPPQLAQTYGIEPLQALVGAHPHSATARVRLGQELQGGLPPRPSEARRLFDRAIELHDQGCALSERNLFFAIEGATTTRVATGDYAGTIPLLQRSVERWPNALAHRYNLACALCRTDQLDACRSELDRVLQSDEAAPAFLRNEQPPVDYYRDLATRDPDLAAVRP